MANELTLADLGAVETWMPQMLSLYEQGMSDLEVATEMKIQMKAFNRLCEISDVFHEAVEYGRQASQAFWYAEMRKGVKKSYGLDPSIAKFLMVNKYKWKDKADDDSGIKKLQDALSLEDMKRKIIDKFKRLKEQNGDIVDVDFEAITEEELLAIGRQVVKNEPISRISQES